MAEPGRGRFVWYDLNTTDPEAAQKFYTDVVGWNTSVWEGGEEPYTMWMAGEQMIGGVGPLAPEQQAAGAPPFWISHISTPDVDATVDQAKKLGAAVHMPPTDIPTVGRFAILADPQGAVFATFAPQGDMPGKGGDQSPGHFSWHELYATDADAAFDFYNALYGWNKTEAMDMGDMGSYQMYGIGEVSFGGMMKKPADMPGPPAWLYYVLVDDLGASVEKIKAGGGQIVNGPMPIPGGDRIVQAMDPQGAMFALHGKGGG
jgi:predicted enzyme related to lactoylglutathione lyase